MDPNAFYASLWQVKEAATGPRQARDPLHRWVLDPIFDPFANSRHDVALTMVSQGHRLLDIGCWNGDFLSRIRESGRFDELEGVDLVQGSVDRARSKGFRAQVIDLNSQPLPYRDGDFDAVTMLAVLEHVFDPYFIVAELHRVLRPGGTLVIAVPNAASFTNRLRILLGRIPVTSADPGWDGGHLHYFTRHAFDRLLQAGGFDVLERRTSGGRSWMRE
jgi:methionine biosynthesis protein MetW